MRVFTQPRQSEIFRGNRKRLAKREAVTIRGSCAPSECFVRSDQVQDRTLFAQELLPKGRKSAVKHSGSLPPVPFPCGEGPEMTYRILKGVSQLSTRLPESPENGGPFKSIFLLGMQYVRIQVKEGQREARGVGTQNNTSGELARERAIGRERTLAWQS